MSSRAPSVNSRVLAEVEARTRRSTPVVPRHVLDRQPAAPRLAEQVDAVQSERVADCVDLGHEAVQRPQRRVVGLLGASAAQLVPEDDRAAGGQRLTQGRDVVAAGARSAVEHEQRRRIARSQPPVPDAAARDVEPALGLHP
jgi:hypothetical protein